VKNHYDDASMQDITVPRNGYLYVYVSNESPVNVFFDNLQVIHTRGQVLEETHYYPFGLTMAGISSKALKTNYAENRKKFNGIEHTTDFDLNTYDAFFRSADPQIGRWWQIDPKPNMAESPYSMMGNNPILNADPLGDTLRGSSVQDARRLQRIIRQTFRGKEMKAVRQMFQRAQFRGDKVTGTGNLYRDGTSHGGTTGTPLTYGQASETPAYLQQMNIHLIMRTFLRILP